MTTPQYLDSQRNLTRIRLILLITLLLLVGFVGMLYSASRNKSIANRQLVVRGDAQWEGMEARVTGKTIAHPYITTFQRLGNYVIPFFLPPGQYELSIRNGHTELFAQAVDLQNKQNIDLDLIALGATTRPTATSPVTPSTLP